MPATNEWEFQGQALSWINSYIASHSVGLDVATQEFRNADGRRSDITIWRNRSANDAALTVELKTPRTSLSDVPYQQDAVRKAQRLGAPYLALWNMQVIELYRTPAKPRRTLLAHDRLASWDPDIGVRTVSDWTQPQVKQRLKERSHDLLRELSDLLTTGVLRRAVVDATVFVDALTERVRLLRLQIEVDVRQELSGRRQLRNEVFNWAAKQGLRDLVGDLYAALAGQAAYRIVGQTLFYLSFRRRQPSLPAMDNVTDTQPLQVQLRAYWDAIRAYDYEALFEESPLEKITLSRDTERGLIELIGDLDGYDWTHIGSDVLGTVFEHLIPADERIALGQYYTSFSLADLIVSLTVDSPNDQVLDPAVGTGTFLLRAHNRLKVTTSLSHPEVLDRLWGVDISGFATELAVINLCRQDLDSQSNFPRVAVRDFFDLQPTDRLKFPPAQNLSDEPVRVEVPLPLFDAVVGNPPYVRSQQLDDLDSAYKDKLAALAAQAGVASASKFDAFAYFLVHARDFLRPGGRLGFVTSAAWLTSTYGNALKAYLLKSYQPVVLLFSTSEPFFPGVAVDTVVLILEARAASTGDALRSIRFATLRRPLQEILPEIGTQSYWARVDRLASEVETRAPGLYDDYILSDMDAETEKQALLAEPTVVRNWARPFKLTPIYEDLFS